MIIKLKKTKEIDNVLNFKSTVPTAWQKSWARNLLIETDEITSKVNIPPSDFISDKQAKKMIKEI